MKKIIIKTKSKTLIADILTPVSIYLKIRDKFANPILLESTDFNGDENSYSIICFNPIATFKVENGLMSKHWLNCVNEEFTVKDSHNVPDELQSFINAYKIDSSEAPLRLDGFFGYSGYDSVQYFETIKLNKATVSEQKIPELQYSFYRYVIAFNHFKSELYIIENLLEGEESTIETIEYILKGNAVAEHKFKVSSNEKSNLTNDEFIEMVKKGKQSCFIGDGISHFRRERTKLGGVYCKLNFRCAHLI